MSYDEDSVVSLGQVRNLEGLLRKLPTGADAQRLAQGLGVWTTAAHAAGQVRQTYPTSFSNVDDNRLSDLNAYWNSESARAGELLGMLEGQRASLLLGAKRARSAARRRIREKADLEAAQATQAAQAAAADAAAELAPGAKERKVAAVAPPKLTITQINDEAEEDPGVQDADNIVVLLETVLASVKAYKEAAIVMAASVSREISFRQAQFGARMRMT